MKLVFVSAALAVLLLGSCATPYELRVDGRTVQCQPGSPSGSVTVASGKITVTPALICVHGKNVAIMWTLDSDGFVFAANGIVIDSNDGAFENCIAGNNGIVAGNGRRFICTNLNPNSGDGNRRTYNYTVNLNRTDGTAAPMPVDPVIMND